MGGHCYLCEGSSLSPLLTGYDRRTARADDYTYFRCDQCGLLFLHTVPSDDEIRSFYTDNYSPHQNAPHKQRELKWINRLFVNWIYSTQSNQKPEIVRALLRPLSRFVMSGTLEPRGDCRLFDIGCGAGAELRKYRDLGWTVCGLDMSANACDACKSDGLRVHQGILDDDPFTGETFDVVVLNHVVEHFADPLNALRRAASYLSKDGLMSLITPNASATSLSVFGPTWYHLDAPRHLFLFNRKTIRLLGSRAGLVPVKISSMSSSRAWLESSRISKEIGRLLPKDIQERKKILDSFNRRRTETGKLIRRLVSPLSTLCAAVGRGDILKVEFRLDTKA